MAKNNNKGVSLVEILIAVVVFSILLIPVITQLISALNINSISKQKSYAIDYAEYTMEYFKSYDFDTEAMLKDANAFPTGTEFVEKEVGYVGDHTGTVRYKEIVYSTKADVGPFNKDYDCKVTIDTLQYALQQLGYTPLYDDEGTEYDGNKYKGNDYLYDNSGNIQVKALSSTVAEDPNSANIGYAKSLDANTDALIVDASNYDTLAESAIYAAKVDILRSAAEAENADDNAKGAWERYLNDVYTFPVTTSINKQTTIKISKSGTGVYTVTCTLDYKDVTEGFETDVAEYVIYSREFNAKPDIYFMFNQFMYNEYYISDNVIFDNSECNDEMINVYYVGTYTDNDAGSTDPEDETLSSKMWKILANEADVNDALKTEGSSLIKQSRDGYYPYDLNNTRNDYLYKVYMNTTNLSNQDMLHIYASYEDDDANPSTPSLLPNNLFGRINGSVGFRNIADDSSCSAIQDGVIKKMEDFEKLDELGRLFRIKVELTTDEGDSVRLYGSRGGN